MDKLTLAHSYALLHMTIPQYKDVDDLELVGWAFDYAEAMLAENEKRKDKSRPEVLDEWQPDWSQAPDGANWWAMDESGRSFWFAYEPYISSEYPDEWIFDGKNHGGIGHEYWKSPNFNYQGDWKDSLRKRP